MNQPIKCLKHINNFVSFFVLLGILTLSAPKDSLALQDFTPDNLNNTNKQLKIIGWDTYTDPERADKTIGYKAFEEQFGVEIVFTPRSSLDSIINEIESGNQYDLVIISNEGINILRQMQLIRPLDTSKLSNFQDLYPQFQNNKWIKSNSHLYAIPMAWGPMGLLYNTDIIPEPDSWNILWDPKYKDHISVRNDISMIWLTALSLGYKNIYNLTRGQLKNVEEKLLRLNKQVYDLYNDRTHKINNIHNGNAQLLNSWLNPTQELRKHNHNYKMVTPGEQTIGKFDSYLITKSTANNNLAYQYINFQISASSQKKMTRSTGLSPANHLTTNLLTKQEIEALHLNDKNYFNQMLLLELMPRKDLYDQLVNIVREDLKSLLQKTRDLNLNIKERRWINDHPVITFTGDPNWLPYEAFDKDGNYIGIVADHLKMIEELTGLEFEPVRTGSWTESLKVATDGKVSIISGDAADVILNQHFIPVNAYNQNPIVIIMNANNNYIEDLMDLKGKSIAIIKDYGYTADIFKTYPDIEFIEVENIQEGLQGVSDKHFDAMLATYALASYTMAEMGMHNIKVVGKTPIIMDLTLFIDNKQPVLHSIINKALGSISKASSHEIIKKWTKSEYVEKTDYILVYQIIISAIILITIFALWNRRLSQEISLRIATEKEIEKSQARFKAMFESIPDAIIYADPDRRIRLVNHAALEMFGYEEKELTGQQTRILYTSEKDYIKQGKKHFNTDSSISAKPYQVQYQSKNGDIIEAETLGTAVTATDGEVVGYLGVIRDISERSHVESILRSLATSSSSINVESFLNEVLDTLTDLYKCQFAFIGKLLPGSDRIKTLAVRSNGQPATNFEYDLDGTPCRDILDKSKELIPKDASRLYPDDAMLIDMGIDSYFGAPLIASDNSVIGIISVMDTSPLALDEWTEPVLGVFATRISLELEKNLAILELQHHRKDLEEQIRIRTADLIKARDEAEKANESKSEFLSRMSHELRTPMNAILGFSQILHHNPDNTLSEIDLSYVEEVLKGGYHLLDLINEVLDLSRVESGQLQLNSDHFDLIEMLNESLTMIQPLAESRGIIIKHNIPDKTVTIHSDRMRLKQITLNLLSNAVKYNQKNGEIIIDYELKDNCVRFSVSDTGPGIPDDSHDRVFEPFDRLGADTSSIEGTGIGLSLSKKMIEFMNGQIGFKSETGTGSTFWIEINCDKSDNIPDKIIINTPQEMASVDGEFSLLYVEDNPANLRLVSNLLKKQPGITLYDTHTASLAIDLINNQQFDLILLDIQLPGDGDGYDILKKIRGNPATRDIPVIAVSANATEYDIKQGMDAGFDEYIVKPINIHHFLKIVNSFFIKKG